MARRLGIRAGVVLAMMLACLADRAEASPWSTAGHLLFRRGEHTATLLQSGVVLIVGGRDGFTEPAPDLDKSVEIFDPATGASRYEGTLHTIYYHTATLYPDGRVFVIGSLGPFGSPYQNGAMRVYDPTVREWSPGAPLNFTRVRQGAVLLPDQTILVAGGTTLGGFPVDNMEYYDPVSDAFLPAGHLNDARVDHVTAPLPNGRVLVAGGGQTAKDALDSAEVYNPATQIWSFVASMTRPRRNPKGVVLPDSRVLVAGGMDPMLVPLNDAEIYTPSTNKWAPAGTLTTPTLYGTLTALRNGMALLVGGTSDQAGDKALSDVQLYDPKTNSWTAIASMSEARSYHTATLLPDGRVLVAGGTRAGRGIDSVEIYSPTCSTAAECGQGFCVDGQCCNEACQGPCSACSASKKGYGADGVCEPIARGGDPDAECPSEAADSCGRTGACNGAGGCEYYSAGAICKPPSCSGSVLGLGSTCDGKGKCADRGVQDCAPYECTAGVCVTTCSVDADCGITGYCGVTACEPKKPVGAACRSKVECLTGECADSVCCDRACSTGTCRACSIVRGASAQGTCTELSGSCDDGNRCTEGEACAAGECGGGSTVVCAAGDACHPPAACDPVTGCTVARAADGTVCDDSSACTRDDQCKSGNCVGTPSSGCAPPGPCEELVVCDPKNAGCKSIQRRDGAACDDGDPCTVKDSCSGGVCAGSPMECGVLDECHLAGSCQTDGKCSTPPKAEGSPCSSGTCVVGVCTPAAKSDDAGVPPVLAPDGGRLAAAQPIGDGGDGGCSCRTSGRGVGPGASWTATMVLLLLARRRRRKRDAPS